MAGPLIGVAVSLLTFVILEIFAPTIAGTIQNAQPSGAYGDEICRFGAPPSVVTNGTCAGGIGNITQWSEWNTTHNTDIPSGTETWITVIQIIGVVFLVIAISIAIFYLKGM